MNIFSPLHRRLITALVALVFLSTPGCASKRDQKPGRTFIAKREVIIPAQLVGNHFIVEHRSDKSRVYRFLVDTGSSVTLVSPDYAKRHATEKIAAGAPTIQVRASDGTATKLPSVTLRQITVGDARFEQVQALIFDFAELSAHLGIKIDGVLGFPLFRETIFTLDYPNSRLVIRPLLSTRHVVANGGATIKFSNTQRTPLIPVRLGRETFLALIDSGSDGPLLLNPVGMQLRYVTEPRPGVAVGTLTGTRSQEIGRLEQPFDIGPYRFETPVVDLTDQFSAIGGEFLRNFAVTFDQSQNQVTFVRDATGPIPAQTRRVSGLSFAKSPTYWRVVGVVPGSPADTAGIQNGDLVTRINGEPVSEWDLTRFETVVRRATEVTFTFLHGSKEEPVVIPTYDLVP